MGRFYWRTFFRILNCMQWCQIAEGWGNTVNSQSVQKKFPRRESSHHLVSLPVWRLPYTISTSFSLFVFSVISPFFYFLPARGVAWECDRSPIFSNDVPYFHEDIRKLWKPCADTVGHLIEFGIPTLSEKWPSAQRFNVNATDRRSPIQVLTHREAA